MTSESRSHFSRSEKRILWVLAAVNFINILDFTMVMPLGPDLAHSLGIPVEKIGLIGGSYTLAAFAAGILGSFILDRINRKTALVMALTGLVAGTWSATAATDLSSLLAARVVAGFFGGPAASSLLAILSDTISQERRGRALGLVMASFSVASVLGVPIGLELARLGGWTMPFWVVGGLGLVVTIAAQRFLPSLPVAPRGSPSHPEYESSWVWQPSVLISFAAAFAAILGTFLMVPNLSAFLQFNTGFPRERLGTLYFFGGILSLFSTRFGGIWNDRTGSLIPTLSATVVTMSLLYWAMLSGVPSFPVLIWFPAYMAANSLRWISISTLTSRVPLASQRGRYMSILSAIQHLGSSSGAILSTQLLHASPSGALQGLPRLATSVLVILALVPPLTYLVEWQLGRRAARHVAPNPGAAFEV